MSASPPNAQRINILGLSLPNPVPRNRFRRQRWYLGTMRTISQLGFFGFIAYAAWAHQWVGSGATKPPSIEAYCPFGGIETLITLIATGQTVQRTFASTLVVFVALVAMTLVAGPAFCGWVCPFGAIQEWIQKLSNKLFHRRLVLPERVDRPLRYLRYVLLAWLFIGSGVYGFLIFRDYDPYITLTHVVSPEFLSDGLTFGFVALVATFVVGLFVERPFCKYFCPLGGFIDLVSKVGLIQVARKPLICESDGACDRACPVDIKVSKSVGTPTGCIGCMQCLAACPKKGALVLSLESITARAGR